MRGLEKINQINVLPSITEKKRREEKAKRSSLDFSLDKKKISN